jgi:hypothetical protein
MKLRSSNGGVRVGKTGLALLVVCAAVLAAIAPGAFGAQTRLFTGTSIGPAGAANPGNFSRLESVFVDQSSGDVYAFDAVPSAKGKIYKFNAAGEPVAFSALSGNAISGVEGGNYVGYSQIAVAPPGSPGGTEGDIYVANSTETMHIYSPSGEMLGALSAGIGATPCGVSVNSVGRVFIKFIYFPGTFGPAVVEYDPTTNPMSPTDEVAASGYLEGCSTGVDDAGNVYVASSGFGNGTEKLEGVTGTPTSIDPAGETVAVDPTTGELFSDRRRGVAEYDSAGNLVARFGQNELNGHGIAVNSTSGQVYATAKPGGRIDVFDGAFTQVPDATIEEATGVGPVEATLHGKFGAAGGPTATCVFQAEAENQTFEHGFENPIEAPCTPAEATGSTEMAATATLTGLAPETNYTARIVGTNSNGANYSTETYFRTPPAVVLESHEANQVTTSSAQLHGTITPNGTAIESCAFEWGTEPEILTHEVPCVESGTDIGTGTAPVEVEAELTGLELGHGYYARLRATNHYGTTRGYAPGFYTVGPRVSGTSVAAADSSATASACLETLGEEATYVVQYVTDAEFSDSGFTHATAVPVGGKAILNGGSCQVEQAVTGLTPSTSYHLRFVVTSAAGTTNGEAVAFNTQRSSSAGLPDGRAYEQVSPVSKNSGNIAGGTNNALYSSPDGEAVTYFSATGAGETESSLQLPIYAAHRSSSGWASEGINPPSALSARMRVLGFTKDLSGSYSMTWNPGEPATMYLREAGGKLVQMATGIVVPVLAASTRSTAAEFTSIVAESAGGAEVYFESPAKLAPGAIEGLSKQGEHVLLQNLYVWTKATGQIRLVDELPDGTFPKEGAIAGAYNWQFPGFAGVGGGASYNYGQETLSNDGNVAVFTLYGSNQIYVRTGLNGAHPTTIKASVTHKTNGTGPNGTDPLGPASAIYLGMTDNGRYVFFKSGEELTNDANTGAADEGEDIYRYDVVSGELKDLAPDPTGIGADVRGIAGFSEDGSIVYVVAGDTLAAGAVMGQPSIYVLGDGAPRYVGTITEGPPDRENWLNSKYEGHIVKQKQARVTPDGSTLVYASSSSGTAGIYRYKLGGTSACVSCNPTGAPGASGSLQAMPTSFVAPQTNRSLMTRNLSVDGTKVFFDTAQSLVSNDHNGVNDVYEWEADGTGTCTRDDENGGCLFLISGGTSPNPSWFIEASASGNDVYFLTTQSLVGQDKDELYDLYDARVGGGIASQNPPPPNPCSGEACLGAASQETASQSPGTATFSGPANQVETKKQTKLKKKKHHKKKHKKKKVHHGKKSGKGKKQGKKKNSKGGKG